MVLFPSNMASSTQCGGAGRGRSLCGRGGSRWNSSLLPIGFQSVHDVCRSHHYFTDISPLFGLLNLISYTFVSYLSKMASPGWGVEIRAVVGSSRGVGGDGEFLSSLLIFRVIVD